MAVNVFSQPGGQNLVYPANSSTARTQQQATNTLNSPGQMKAPTPGTYGGLQPPSIQTHNSMGPNNAVDPSAQSASQSGMASQSLATNSEVPVSKHQKVPQGMPRIHVGNSPTLARLRGMGGVMGGKIASQAPQSAVGSKLASFYGITDNSKGKHRKEAIAGPLVTWGARGLTGGLPRTAKAFLSLGRAGEKGMNAVNAAKTTASTLAKKPGFQKAKQVGGDALKGMAAGAGADVVGQLLTARDINDGVSLGGGALLGGLGGRFYRRYGKGALGGWLHKGQEKLRNTAFPLHVFGQFQDYLSPGTQVTNITKPWQMYERGADAVQARIEQGLGMPLTSFKAELPEMRESLQQIHNMKPLMPVARDALGSYLKTRQFLSPLFGQPRSYDPKMLSLYVDALRQLQSARGVNPAYS